MPDLLDQLPDRQIADQLSACAQAIRACRPLCRETGLPVLIQLSERAPDQLTTLAAACRHAPIQHLRRYRRQGQEIAQRVVEWLEAAPILLAHAGLGRTIHPAVAHLVPALQQAAGQITRLDIPPQLPPQDPGWRYVA